MIKGYSYIKGELSNGRVQDMKFPLPYVNSKA